jgi:stringent starvation protein B
MVLVTTGLRRTWRLLSMPAHAYRENMFAMAKMVLNVGYDATAQLNIANDCISFQARFGGVARDIAIPIGNVSAIYARENGAGMAFEPEKRSRLLVYPVRQVLWMTETTP